MLITLLRQENISTLVLPEKVRGQYWLYDTAGYGKTQPTISVEGVDGNWYINSTNLAAVIENDRRIRRKLLQMSQSYTIRLQKNNENAVLLTEPITDDRQIYHKSVISDNTTLKIGRSHTNDIIYEKAYVSSTHAELTYRNHFWIVTDLTSRNGTYINSRRISGSATVACGACVYIMGLKIVLGAGFIAYNNPDGNVSFSDAASRRFICESLQNSHADESQEDYEDLSHEERYFYRSPRFKRDIEKIKLNVDAPPQNQIGEETPMALLIGPSMTMGMASLATGAYTVINAINNDNIASAVPSMVMSGSMLLGTVMWPIINKQYEKKRRRKKEGIRQKRYKEYLGELELKLRDAANQQAEIMHENGIMLEECQKRILERTRYLWERSLGQNDFLELRLGVGNHPLQAELTYPDRRFSMEDDDLLKEMYELCESPKIIKGVPIVVSLYKDYISGIIGKKMLTHKFVQGLILQIAALYSYDEVKLVFIHDAADFETFKFVKWLPHTWSNDKSVRFIATNESEMKELAIYLEREYEERKDLSEEKIDKQLPYYVIFCTSNDLARQPAIIKSIATEKNLHISIVFVSNRINNLPKECTNVIELEPITGRLFDKNDMTGSSKVFSPEFIDADIDMMRVSKALANIPLNLNEQKYALPSLLTFLQMFGVGKVEHLNISDRWRENDPTKSLETPVGVNCYGELFKIDLHEKFHGPHGLIAGMTGSGKSEFIITLILSLAVNYHPDEVAFILIDYKGGGMAKSFEKLPHTAGIVTNLDGSAIKRSLISIESELKRRQTIFAQTSQRVGISNIDIYKYQKLYREGTVTEPMQHLFIISDEFAELKTQQPEFMAQLISAARIGRSLGVHLILATQKPSGVVDDQIWSNSRFRICLKVQEKSDSMDMLKRPDAAELAETGRFYMQVGYNEIFELGQSSWAGAPYYPSDRVVAEKDESLAVLDTNGKTVRRVILNKKKLIDSNPSKQLDIVTEYICDIAKEEGARCRPLWLEPIPEKIYIDDICEKYDVHQAAEGLQAVIGEYDDPEHQAQGCLMLDLSANGNTAVYGASGSGKTTFVSAIIYSIIKNYTAEQVNLYLLDFASESLRAFEAAPQVGDVVYADDSEKIVNLFRLLRSEVDKRRKILAGFGGDLSSYSAETGKTIPYMLVIINNYAAFREMFEEMADVLQYLTREGTKYGIYFVLTAIGTSDIRFKMQQNFKQMFVLQLNDENEYSTVVGRTDGVYPAKFKGRGLFRGDSLYEFQTAQICEESPFQFAKSYCQQLADSWDGLCARKIPVLPDVVDVDFLSGYYNSKYPLQIPVGVEARSLEVYKYSFVKYITVVSSTNNIYADFITELVSLLAQNSRMQMILIHPNAQTEHIDSETVLYHNDTEGCQAAVDRLFDLVLQRNNTYKEAVEAGEAPPKFDHTFVFINGASQLFSLLTDMGKEKLSLLLEKGEAAYNISIVIGETAKNLSAYSYSKWYKKHLTQSDGIWIGNGITEQYQLKPAQNTAMLREDITNEFGYALVDGRAKRLKMLKHLTYEVNDGEDYC